MRVLPTNNEGYGFSGEVSFFISTYTDGNGFTEKDAWDAAFKLIASIIAPLKFGPEKVVKLLDSGFGRHFFDTVRENLPETDPDGRKKVTVTTKQIRDAVAKAVKEPHIMRTLQSAKQLARYESLSSGGCGLAEDFGDIPFHANPGDFLVKKGDNFASNDLYAKIGKHIKNALFSKAFNQHYRTEVLALLRKDKALLQQIRAEGFTLSEAHMRNEITTAVFETEETDDLPFTGEMVVESLGEPDVVLDESDLFEDVVIEALEDAIAEAVSADPNAHVQAVREIDEALQEGNYEIAVELGTALLQKCGVDEAQIDEFKKGFKVSGSQRAKMMRMRKKPKTGSALMALRARRRAARKSSSL